MKLLAVFLCCFVLFSCSSRPRKVWDFSNLGNPSENDYIDHLAWVGSDFLTHEENKEIKLNEESKKYLSNIHDRILKNNEIVFNSTKKPEFHFIKDKTPFLFSLPQSQYFFSTGLMEKYLKNEELYVAALAAEILRSNRNIYEKKMVIPLGFFTVEKMLSLTKIKTEIKIKIDEWAYFVLKRSGYDASAYLNWIQVQNRNTLDFSLYLGDSMGITKEEHFFKNFLAKQGIASVEKKINESNSSKEFYRFLNNIVSKR